MKKIFVFGDSFSASFKPKEDELIENFRHHYIKWLGYTPKCYGEFMSEKLNIELVNKSVGGYCNSDIFESICSISDIIKNGDIIIIGWTKIERFRLARIDDDTWWINFNSFFNEGDYDAGKSILIGKQTMNEILVNRTNSQYKTELFNWIKLINITFKNNKIFHWSWDTDINQNDIISKPVKNIKQIRDVTNYEVNDRHWEEGSHKTFALYIIENLNLNLKLI